MFCTLDMINVVHHIYGSVYTKSHLNSKEKFFFCIVNNASNLLLNVIC